MDMYCGTEVTERHDVQRIGIESKVPSSYMSDIIGPFVAFFAGVPGEGD